MSYLTQFFSDLMVSPILRILLVIGLGLLLGDISFPGGFKLGVAGVLFTGLAMGALLHGIMVPPVLQELGLILFVYGVGLQTGPGFFRSFRKDGLRLNGVVAGVLVVAFLVCAILIRVVHLASDTVAGLFCGALTNTPALGAATEAIGRGVEPGKVVNAVVVGYGMAYPFAIMVVLSLIQFFVSREKKHEVDAPDERMDVRTLRVSSANGHSLTAAGLESLFRLRVTRVCSPQGQTDLQRGEAVLRAGSLITVVGTASELEKAAAHAGHLSQVQLQSSSSDLETADFRVSNRTVCSRPIHELEAEQGRVIISRIRRGDVELSASPTITLQPGDEVRVVAHRSDLDGMARFFGNSITALSETSYLTFVLGIVLGLLVGQIPIPIPGLAAPLRLGMAGGPLLVGILLGWLGRTGPLVWTMSYGLNLGIRNFGILLFLAAVGANAGASLPSAFKSEGPILIFFAVLVTFSTHLLAWAGLKLAGEKDIPTLLGVLSGLQTQPAALGFAAARVSPEKVQLGYASVYPLATILKIIFAQLLLGIG